MMLFDLAVFLVFVFLITGVISLINILIITYIILFQKNRKRKHDFNKLYPTGSFYFSYLKKRKFPCGKWEYLGKDQNNKYVYERTK